MSDQPAGVAQSVKITSVHYSKLVNLGNYENEKIAAWAAVEDGQAPEEVLTGLKEWVEHKANVMVARKEEESQLERRISELDWQTRQMTNGLKEMRETYKKAYAFLQKLGPDLPRELAEEADDMPF